MTKKQSLLEKALAVRVENYGEKQMSDEEIELVVAFLKKDITVKQLRKATGLGSGEVQTLVRRCLAYGFQKGKLRLALHPNNKV